MVVLLSFRNFNRVTLMVTRRKAEINFIYLLYLCKDIPDFIAFFLK